MVPNGANAVVKVEETAIDSASSNSVNIKIAVDPGMHIREIGSDMKLGEVVLRSGERIGPAEVGLLATVGLATVHCYLKPTIGVLSTGSELIEPW